MTDMTLQDALAEGRETRMQVRRWFVETGWADGNGIGLWDGTDESVEVSSRAEAEALRDEWLASGKIELDQWGNLHRTGPYGAFRIRSVWDDVPGDLIPATDAQLAVALVVRMAGEMVAQYGSSLQADDLHRALAPALAEVQALRAERDSAVKDAAEWATIAADNSDRAEAAEAKLAVLTAYGPPEFYVNKAAMMEREVAAAKAETETWAAKCRDITASKLRDDAEIRRLRAALAAAKGDAP